MMGVEIRSSKRKKRTVQDPRVRCQNLTKGNAAKLSKKAKVEGNWKQVEDAYQMWEVMAECIRRWAKEILGSSRGGGGTIKGLVVE